MVAWQIKIWLFVWLAGWRLTLAAPFPTPPRTLEELNRSHVEPPSNQNAAMYFLRGGELIKIKDSDRDSGELPLVGRVKLPQPRDPLSPTMIMAIVEFVERNAAVMRHFQQAAKCEESRYPVNYSQGLQAEVAYAEKLKKTSVLLLLRTLAESHNQQHLGSGQTLYAHFALVRSLQAEPWLYPQVLRSSFTRHATEGAEQALNRGVLPADSLKQLRTLVDPLERHDSAGTNYARALIGDQIMIGSLFDLPVQRRTEVLAGMLGKQPEEISGLFLSQSPDNRDRDFLTRSFDELKRHWTRPYPERLSFHHLIRTQVKQATQNGFVVSSRLLPQIHTGLATEARGLASLRLAQTALALEEFRTTHGNQYPERLRQLTPVYLSAVPQDPYDGKPLRYRRSGRGYKLYSIGPDLRDNGGRRDLDRGQAGDLVFEVIRPP